MNLPEIKGEPPFIWFETIMANRLGLSRDEARALRQAYLTENVHWRPVKKKIYLTDEAVNLLVAKKGLPLPAPVAPDAPRPIAAQRKLLSPPFEGKLVAWGTPVNTRILMAHFPGVDGSRPEALVRVQVRDNRNFTKGMPLTARHIQGDLYELVGPCPRWRGKQ